MGVVAQCPSCAGNGSDLKGKKHLSAYEQDGWIHVRCVTEGCSEDDILRALGMTTEDRRTDAKRGTPDEYAVYTYTDAKGSYAFEKIRYRKLDGTKGFLQQVRFRGGIPLPQVPKDKGQGLRHQTPAEAGIGNLADVLYRLPEILRAVQDGKTIYLGEGEKAADLMWRKGLPATCQPHGAGSGKWKKCHTDWLKGASKVIVVADRDEKGEAYATQIFTCLRAEGIPCTVVYSKTRGEKDDAYDHFIAGHGPEDFEPAAKLMPKRGLKTRTMPEAFRLVEAKYLVEPYLPAGKSVLMDADGGTGKSSLALAWAACLGLGIHPVTKEKLPCGPVKTLYLHKGEDSDEELETVYRANGGVPGMIEYAGADLVLNEAGICDLQDTILDGGYRLVVFDALFYFLQGVVKDTAVALDVMGVMQRLNDVAELTGCTFLNIRHTTKGPAGKQASDLGMGSVQFRNSHRGQLVLRWHPDMKGGVVVTQEKGFILGAIGEHFVFKRVGLEVQLIRNCPNPFQDTTDAGTKSKLKLAKDFLTDLLTGNHVKSTEVYEGAKELGISPRTVKTAIAELGVKSYKRGVNDGWVMYIQAPEGYDPFADKE